MSSNSNMTPSPKQRNRFVSTLRRTLRSNPQPSSPATPPFGRLLKIRALTYLASSSPESIFSALLKSRDSSSSSPTSSGSKPVPTEELMIPCPSFFAIPASRQPSVIEQSDIRLDQTTNPPNIASASEIFDLIDAGMSDEQFDDIIGDDISYEARNLPTAPASDSPHLVEAATIDEPVIAPECADAEKPIVAIEPSEECTTGESIQAFLQSLSSSLRNDPTEFSPRISEWDQESSRFSFQLDDELHSQERSAREDINYLNLRSSAYITQFPRFLKRTPARVKKNLPTRSA
ncbi:hypothetical protein KEM48_007147 [Puccinia striiformis f. sp. tritici PST-130]|nr:hypothetical protein KEM48_007147 [Puccinia striiformis f. sp. tritici PST-130]